MRIIKRITASVIVLSALLLQMPSATVNADSKISVKSIGLQQAIDIGIENNLSVKLIDDKIFLAERALSHAKANAKRIKGNYGTQSDERIANAKTEILYPLQKEAALNDLNWEKENIIRTLKFDITKLYYQIMLKQQQIEMQNILLNKTKAEYDVKKKHVDAGTLSASSLFSYEIAVDEAATNLAALQRDLKKYVMDMNALIGLDINQSVNFKKQDIPDVEFEIKDIEQVISELLKVSHTIEQLESEKYLTKKERDITSGYAVVNTPDELDDLDEKILNLDYKINDAKAAVEYNMRSGYNNILNLKDNIAIKQLNLEKENKLLEIATAKYNLGLITPLEYQKAQTARDSAQMNYRQSMLDYFLAIEQFKMDIYPVTVE